MTLTIQDLGALGDFFGSIAVLATLIYLALQTRQNTLAISAQLDAARLDSVGNLNLAVATSTELEEALNEDRIEPMATNQARREHYWTARFFMIQWNFIQARRGLLPGSSEARMGLRLLAIFNGFRSIEGWWEARTTGGWFDPDFVAWVEDQRSKAA